ncbi:MAG: YsnF/AvaK domain-containing protein, partial [Chloroflexota bacterium]|nr:YsnF/AvaK domain-containing protein [Chloroflexota bacterium]
SIERGSVHVQKEVVATSQSFDIPLHEEDLRVVRHRIEREDATSEIPADAFIEMEIEIPIRGEEIEVRKRPVVRDQVVISKVVRERARQVTETLRREELHVEGGDGITAEMRDGSRERRRDRPAL